jgi:hypothetical protein
MHRGILIAACTAGLAACSMLRSPDERFAYDVQQGMRAMQERQGEAAEQWFEDAHAASQAFGPHDPRPAQAINMIAWSYQARGQFVWALVFHAQALDAQREALGPQHPEVARILVTRAETHADMGNFHDAAADLAEAQAIFAAALGPEAAETKATGGYLEQVRRRELPSP